MNYGMIKDSFLSLFSEFVGKVSTFFIMVIIARKFGDKILGEYSYAFSFSVIFLYLANIGIAELLMREVAIDKSKALSYLGNAIYLKLVLNVCTLILISFLVYFAGKSVETYLLVFILLFQTLFKSFSDFIGIIFKAYEKLKYAAYFRIVESFLMICSLLYLVYAGRDIIIIAESFAAISFVIMIAAATFLRYKFVNFKIRKDRNILFSIFKKSLSFGVSSIMIILYMNLNILMMSLMKGDKETGLYFASFNLFFATTVISQPLDAVLFPILSRKIFELRNDTGRMKIILKSVLMHGLLMTFGGIFVAAVMYFFSDSLVNVIYGPEFSRSSSSLKLLALAIPVWYAYMIIKTILYSLGKQTIFIYSILLGISINAVLNFALIPFWGGVGASASALCAALAATSFALVRLIIVLRNQSRHSFD